ncbi:MAG: hypothetical protein ABW071_05475 [Casimicrobiaceae bacterium]
MRPTSGALRAALVNIGYPDTSSDIGAELLELKRDRADLVRANLAFRSRRDLHLPNDAAKNLEWQRKRRKGAANAAPARAFPTFSSGC